MKWYEKIHTIDDRHVIMLGHFIESEVTIHAWIQTGLEPTAYQIVKLYQNTVNMWAYQEILAEDVLSKYEGMIRKYENKLPSLLEKYEFNERI